ncbi:hypothetical protein [Streptomyces agglomeratus]
MAASFCSAAVFGQQVLLALAVRLADLAPAAVADRAGEAVA